MTKQNTGKRLLSLVLSIMMVLSLFSVTGVTAYAADEVSENISLVASPSANLKTISGTHYSVSCGYMCAAESGMQVCKAGALTINARKGETITKVVLTYNWGNNKSSLSASAGTFDGNATISDINAQQVTISSSNTAGVKISAVTVYFEGSLSNPTVTLTGGANAKSSGGLLTQSYLPGAMDTVTYTALTGAAFPEFETYTLNGVTVERTSDTVVTISGTPTANTEITVPDAESSSKIVTWGSSIINTIDRNGYSDTANGITLTKSGSGYASLDYGDWMLYGDVTLNFTTATGKFTSIEIETSSIYDGGNWTKDGNKLKWNGTPSNSVSLSGSRLYLEGVSSINFVIEMPTVSVTVIAGDNMTKTTDSGEASQSDLSGAMTDVVYTADDGYYFPEDYSVEAVNGISVTRNSYTQITVSGTPTADAAIALTAPTAKTTPDAPTTATATDCTTADNNDGTLTGVTTAMEYKKSDAADWTAGTGSDITGLVPGTYYVRVKATETTNASTNQELTIKGFISYTVTFKVVNGKWNEGEGDAATADKTVTLTGHDGDTLKLTADQIPAVGSKPNDTYKAGSWDVTPSADTAITAATTYTYTYAAKEASVVTKAPEAKTLTYNGQAQALVTAGTANGGTMQYAIGNATEATEPYTASVPSKTNAGPYYVYYKVIGDGNHTDSQEYKAAVTINKAVPDYTVPEGLTAQCGTKVRDVELPEGFAWDTPDEKINNIGDNSFDAVYTPEDTANYNTIDPVTITVKGIGIHHAEIPATCEEDGVAEYWEDGLGNKFSDENGASALTNEQTVIEKLNHTYGEPTYEWNFADGKWTCTATRVCGRVAAHIETETVTATSAVKTPATCEEKGVTTYTAAFTNTAFSQQTKDETNIDALDHTYGEPTYEWNYVDGNWTCTATRVCGRDGTHIETETVTATSKVDKAAACEEKGDTTYTATFENSVFAAQTKTVTDIEELGHKFINFWKWVWDGFKSAVIWLTCDNEPDHIMTIDVPSKVDTVDEPTCTEDGYNYYVATIDVAGTTYTTVKVETVDQLGHKWGEPTYTWNDNNSECTAERACTRDASHTETETVKTTYKVITPATCEEDGLGRYTAAFENEAFEAQTKDITLEKLGHEWTNPVWNWTSDTKASVTLTCAHDKTHTKTVDAAVGVVVTEEPTEEKDGVRTYTAKVTVDGVEYITTRTETIPKIDPTPVDPTPVVPTPDVPTPDVPTPDVPTPDEPTPDVPTPDEPTPVVPTPDEPTPVVPTPDEPTPATPDEPTPVVPTPDEPTPVVPTPDVPTPVVPTPDEPTPDVPKPAGLLGDANCDGVVDSADALAILRNSANLEEFDDTQKLLSDVDGDGVITAGDALEVLRYSAKLSANENIGKPVTQKAA